MSTKTSKKHHIQCQCTLFGANKVKLNALFSLVLFVRMIVDISGKNVCA